MLSSQTVRADAPRAGTERRIETILPLTPVQTGLLFHALAAPGSGVYLVQTVLRLRGCLDRGHLEQAWQRVVARHQALRSAIHWREIDKPLQVIHREVRVPLRWLDWRDRPESEQRRDLERAIHEDRTADFDLASPPLLRVTVFELGSGRFVLAWAFHHLILDGWSQTRVLEELFRAYEDLAGGTAQPLLPSLQLQDHVRWLKQRDTATEEAFWRARVGGIDELTPLGFDGGKAEAGSGTAEVRLSSEATRRLEALARRERITVASLVQAAWALLLGRYGGRDRVVFGVTVSGRPSSLAGAESIVGLLINTLPLDVRLPHDGPLDDWLRGVHRRALEMLAHQATPLHQIAQWSGVKRGEALFESVVVFENYPVGGIRSARLADLEVEGVETAERPHYPLTLSAEPRVDALVLRLLFARDRFDRVTCRRLLGHLRRLLELFPEAGRIRLSALDFLSLAERHQILRELGGRPAVAVSDELADALAAAERHAPDRIRMVWNDGMLTGSALGARARAIEADLRAAGVGPEAVVAVLMDRTPDAVAVLLATLRTGGVFLPLDPGAPEERLRFLLRDGAARVLVVEDPRLGRLAPEHVPVIFLGERRVDPGTGRTAAPPVPRGALAYLIYTSGSTGEPKAVGVSRDALLAHLRQVSHRFGLRAEDRVLQFAALTFDVALEQILAPLLAGGTIVLRGGGSPPTGEELWATVVHHRVSVINPPTGFWHQVQESADSRCLADASRSLRLTVVGGDALFGRSVARWRRTPLGHVPLVNAYGPTEGVITATSLRVADRPAGGGEVVPVGAPLPGRMAYVLDGRGGPAPLRVPGELVLAGPILARGYFRRPCATAERFVPDPFGGAGSRMYRTGDLARWEPDGALAFLGRLDRQVKVRGFRIEPGEIEAALVEHPSVREAAVAGRIGGEDGASSLVAVVVPSGEPPTVSSLRDHLTSRLPAYMVPGAFAIVDRLPLTPSGKVDRRALLQPGVPLLNAAGRGRPPASMAERVLAEVWSQVLGVGEVSADDDFFELGGDSISTLQVVSRARREGIEIDPGQVFERRTLARLAAVAGSTRSRPEAPGGEAAAEIPLTPIQRWFFEHDVPRRSHWNQSVLLASREKLMPAALQAALDSLGRVHDALRLRFEPGPQRWRQHRLPGPVRAPLSRVDLASLDGGSGRTALEDACAWAQRSLDLEAGPLFRAVLVRTSGTAGDRLLLVAHHLIVDAVSWRILLEDLERAYRAVAAGGGSEEPTTISFARWAELLGEHARTGRVVDQLGAWCRRLAGAPPPLPRDRDDGPDIEGSVDTVTVDLDAATTSKLLETAAGRHRLRLDTVLLAALAACLTRWSGSSAALVELEGHGREEIAPGLDLSRTVGWFTVQYPILIDLEGAVGAGDRIERAREALAAVPDSGIGYSLLRYGGNERAAARLESLPRPEVLFNYLGRLDRAAALSTLFRVADERFGPTYDPASRRSHPLEVVASVRDGALRVVWRYSRGRYERDTVVGLAAGFLAELREATGHLSGAASSERLPEEALVRLDREALRRVTGDGPPIDDLYPLTPLQEGLLFHALDAPSSALYCQQMVCRLRGDLDAEALLRTWHLLLDRHPVLRTDFAWQGLDEPVQVVRRTVPLVAERDDWRGDTAGEQARRLEELRARDRERGFDLGRAPLLRLYLVRTGDREHLLVWSHHHLLLDGWSVARLTREALQLYRSVVAGAPAIEAPPPPFRDLVAWLRRQDPRAGEAYWREALSGFEAPTPVGLRRRAPGSGDPDHGEAELRLPAGVRDTLGALTRRAGVTLSTVFSGLWALLLSRYSGQDDVVFGTVTAGRPAELPGVEEMVGLFINTIPVRVRVEGSLSTLEWLRRMQSEQVAARRYEHTPLTAIQAWSDIPAGEPLFHSIFMFENYPVSALRDVGGGIEVASVETFERPHYPLTLIVDREEGIRLRLLHDRAVLRAVEARRALVHLGTLLRALAGDSNGRVDRLELLSPGERHQALVEWAGGEQCFEEDLLHEQFMARARETPDATAVVGGGSWTTYGHLARRSAAWAAELRNRGVGPGALVGICHERNVELAVAFLAVLRTGAAYVPLDPRHPSGRLELVARDAELEAVLCSPALRDLLPGAVDAIVMDGDPPEPAALEDVALPPTAPAYVIYTSGSSGHPKGVIVRHGNVTRLFAGSRSRFGFGADDVWTLFHSPAFDFSVWELWGPLLHGGRVVMVSYWASRAPAETLLLVEKERVTFLNQTPSAFQSLSRAEEDLGRPAMSSLRCVVFGGEALDPGSLRPWVERHGCRRPSLVNMYGITETTVHVTYRRLGTEDIVEGAPSVIGTALPDLRLLPLDARMRPVPAGIPGELHVGGPGLAAGYLGRSALTAARFVPDPYGASAGARLYRSGDLARRLPDGDLEFAGRADRQVKIRGFRIELGEIEARLAVLHGVSEAVVMASGDGSERRLVAYVVPTLGAQPEPEELRRELRTLLPDYMVPEVVVALRELPLTVNGKVDFARLPAPESAPAPERRAAAPPSGGVAREVVSAAAAEVLGLEEVDPGRSFFDLGGHSLHATRLASRLQGSLGLEVPLRRIFEASSLSGLAEELEDRIGAVGDREPPPLRPVPRERPLPLSYAQQRLWFLAQLEGRGAGFNIPRFFRLLGNLVTRRMARALRRLVERHEAFRTRFPAHLGEPRQLVTCSLAAARMPVVDLSAVAPAAARREADRLTEAEARRPFDLAAGPLFRATLVRCAPRDHLLLITVHHIVGDAWSMGVLVRDAMAFYRADEQGREPALPALPVQYADYAVWQRSWLDDRVLEEQSAYWRRRLAGAEPLHSLATDRPRPEVLGPGGESLPVSLSPDLARALRDLGRRRGATLFMTLAAGFVLLLRLETDRDDVVIGIDVDNRNRRELEDVVGFFVNQLPLRADVSGNPTFEELLERVRRALLEAYSHRDLPFDRLPEVLGHPRSLAHAPVFQIKLYLQNAPVADLELPQIEVVPLPASTATAPLDLTCGLWRGSDGRLDGTFNYKTDLFHAGTARRLAARFERLLETVAAEPAIRAARVRRELMKTERETDSMIPKTRRTFRPRELGAIRPKAVNLPREGVVEIGVLEPGRRLPALVRPTLDGLDLADWAAGNRQRVEDLLHEHGAVLFRGFGVDRPEPFESFASVLCDELFEDNGEHEKLEHSVFTPVFYPPEQKLLWHNENSFNHRWPRKIIFCCAQPAKEGGETPLADSREVRARIDPEVRRRFEELGVMYQRNYHGDGLGRRWQTIFGTDDRGEVERICREQRMEAEWHGDRLRTIAVRPAIVEHPVTGEACWFNQTQHWHVSCLDPETRRSVKTLFAPEELPRHCYYGDGSTIPDQAMAGILAVYRNLEVSFPWQRGDVLLVDNVLAAHARNPYRGERKILVAIGDGQTFSEQTG